MERLNVGAVFVFLISVLPSIYAGDFDTCSYHAEITCADFSKCIDNPNGFECVCEEDYYGDGYRAGSGCLPNSGLYPCESDNDCHSLASCDFTIGGKCRCFEGYDGNGKDVCADLNECQQNNPCHPDARCQNTPGSFYCTCKENYKGNGFNCTFYCNDNQDCHENATCNRDTQCECKNGFEGDGRYNCTDINECLLPNSECHNQADCINTIGSYECICKPGYKGDGTSCERIPINCHEHYMLGKKWNGFFEIDPDGSGPLLPFKVECHMRRNIEMGITIIRPLEPKFSFVRQDLNDTVEYDTTKPNTMAVIDNSGYCYQDMSARCIWYSPKFLSGDDFWFDRNGQPHQTWGGSVESGKCICGELGTCRDPASSCNCDGAANDYDTGRLFDRQLLPVDGFKLGLAGWQRIDVTLGPVICGPKPFDIPIDCHDAKINHKRHQSGPMIIDVDGPDGPLEPTYVECDMESYPHVGITVIPHHRKFPESAVNPETFNFNYIVPPEVINKLIDNSTFCRQEVSYTCTDSRISNGGTFLTDNNGQQMSSFPGAYIPDGCACGSLNTCANGKKCNCDNYDGIERKDFGSVTNRSRLPLASMSLNDLGSAGQKGEFLVGPLKCSQMEFGFEATCEGYRLRGHDDSYVYTIDPDGPVIPGVSDPSNTPPFPVECEMKTEPPQGITIVHHQNDTDFLIAIGDLDFGYSLVTDEQLVSLRKRSVFCVQRFQYNCTNAPLYDPNGGPIVYWEDVNGNQRSYYAGTGQDIQACGCGLTQTCEGGTTSKCNCDISDSVPRQDSGNLIHKDDLPIKKILFPNDPSRSSSVNVGPLTCSDTHPTCMALWTYMKQNRLPSEHMPKPYSVVTIDPDGAGGVDPFRVNCRYSITIVPVEPQDVNHTNTDPNNDPVKECFNITYANGVSKEQVTALKDNSQYCTQTLKYECLNAPVTDKVMYETCDEKEQPGWAGSNGEDKCGCGVTGTCEGGKDSNCNCDLEDGKYHADKGQIFHEDRLPVCKVCIELDPPKDVNSPRIGTYSVTDLQCNGAPIGLYSNCQQRRNHRKTEDETIIIDPDGRRGATPPFPVHCSYEDNPATGTAEIRPKDEEKPVPQDGNVPLTYFIFDDQIDNVKKLVKRSRYCEQEVYLLCGNATRPPIEEGRKLDQWTWKWGGGVKCRSGFCHCYGDEVFGGIVRNQARIPVVSVKLPRTTSTHPRKLHIGPVKCYNIYRHCHEIRWYRMWGNPNKDNIYAIDPDLAGGEPYFPVTCDFKTNRTFGITIVPIKPDKVGVNITIFGSPYPQQKQVPVEYRDANPKQVNNLGKVSDFCYQGVQYKCFKSPIYNETNGDVVGSYSGYDGSTSAGFGTGDHTDADGCVCSVLNSCEAGNRCHCDSQGPMFRYDYGVVSKDTIPVTEFEFSNSDLRNSYGLITVTDVKCAPKPFNLPLDCEDARKKGYKTGEVLIWPRENVDPFFVHCNINDLVKGLGVAIIGNNVEEPQVIDPTNDTDIKVNYTGVTDEQVEALTKHSQYCYMPIKYDCLNSLLLGADKFEWSSSSGTFKYLGTGTNAAQTCSCGNAGYCGGNDTRSVLETRKCNCDAGEGEWSRDAGIFANKEDLPIIRIKISQSDLPGSNGTLTLGKLYCAEKEFDLNECALGFHDCHPLAYCKNTKGSFECQCKAGFRGADVPNVWANGRNCYDDDECQRRVCPPSADCINEPGRFSCVCKDGYDQLGPRECRNIDECANDTMNDCHKDAQCFDLQGLEGKYKCRCKQGFDGNGTHCAPVGTCSCFGDPHCKSFDKRWLHFQGDCQYVMSTDGCNGNPPNYEIRSTYWNQDKPYITDVSWVKELEITLFEERNHTITLMQNYEVMIDGILKKLPYLEPDQHFYVRKYDRNVKLSLLKIGINVVWDGKQSVEIIVSDDYMNKTCGLCGDFDGNATNDWVIGDECPNPGSQTNNENLFSNSWAIKEYVENNECRFDCNAQPPAECSATDKAIAQQYCNQYIYDGERYGKKFLQCLANMTNEEQNEFFVSCVTDVCKNMKDKMGQLCDHAAELVRICADEYMIEITGWKTSDMCFEQCGEFEEYGMASEADQTDCTEVIQNTTLQGKSPIPVEGCYCKEGYVMDAGQCVLPEECGCIYNGSYYSIGDVIVPPGCAENYVCGANNTLEVSPQQCHEHASCGLKDGVHGCHCDEGFVSMDNSGTDCIEDPCVTAPCNGTGQKCVLNSTDDKGYTCQCIMGYQGDCNKCEDIDECATHTDDCTSNAKCKNLNGSYECECYSGFTDKTVNGKDQCVDIDECESGLDNCDNMTTKCVNILGGFQCLPCEGGTEGEGCCVCVGPLCDQQGQVCGTDGQTYETRHDLIIADCILQYESSQEGKEKRIATSYEGECQATCQTVKCKKYQECVENEGSGTPSCECEQCTEVESEEKEVCSTMLDSFRSVCEFKKEMCKLDMEEELLTDNSPCEDEKNGPPVSEWEEWSNCSVPCGNGTKTRSRNATANIDTDYLEEKYPLEATANCYNEPCPNSACANLPCEVDGEVCVENEGTASCECPNCIDQGVEEVCGKVGDIRETYKNPCEVQATGCQKGEPFDILHEGKCGVEPLECTKMENFVRKSHQGCVKMVNLGKCDGGCGIYSNHCCRPKNVVAKNETFMCNGNTYYKEFQVIEECECQEEPVS